MNQLVENKWNPVPLSGRRNTAGGTYNISSYAISSSWYNKVTSNDGSRYTRLKNYHEVDMCSVEISRALDIIAEDVSSVNADADEPIFLDIDEDKKVKRTQIKLLGNAKDMWEKRTEFDCELFDRVRRTLKFGATFYRTNKDGSITELPPERMVGYVLSEDDENVVTHYLYDANIPRVDNRGRMFTRGVNGGVVIGNKQNDQYESISVDELLIMKVGSHPFGESVIERVYGTWRTMKLIEDSVVVYRVTRSSERRVYYIDVGNLQGPKREAAIERQRVRLMQKKTAMGGELHTNYDPHSMGEDIFIPTNSTGKGSRVDMLQGGAQLGELTDLEWFYKKLAAGLRIPSSLIDPNDQSQNQHTDARVGQLYAAEYRYLSHVKRIKVKIAAALHKNFKAFCSERGIAVPDEGVKIMIADSMSFAEYKDMERNQGFLNVANSTLQLPQLSKRMVMTKYLGLTEEEMIFNEECKLREKGLTDDQIKNMEQSEVDQIVYGKPKPEVLEKYGLSEEEEGGRGW